MEDGKQVRKEKKRTQSQFIFEIYFFTKREEFKRNKKKCQVFIRYDVAIENKNNDRSKTVPEIF
jgi:hypothetical protein